MVQVFSVSLLLLIGLYAFPIAAQPKERIRMLCQQWLYEPSLSQPPASLLEQEFEPSTTEYQLSSPMQQYHLAHYEFATLHFLRSGKLRYRNKGGIIREGRWQLSNDYQTVLLQIDGKSIR